MNAPIATAAALVAVTLWTGATTEIRRAWPPPPPKFDPPEHGVLFADDFSDGDLKGWVVDRERVWSVQRGMLKGELPDEKQQRSFIYAGDIDWRDYAVDLDVCGMRGVDKGAAVRVDGDHGIGVDLRGPGYHDIVLYRSRWPLGKASATNGNAIWHHLRIEARAETFRVYVNGELKIDRRDGRAHKTGRIALPAYTGGVGECTVYYDNVVVTRL